MGRLAYFEIVSLRLSVVIVGAVIIHNNKHEHLFDFSIAFSFWKVYYIPTRIFERVFLLLGGVRMKNNISKDFVIEMLKKVEDSDQIFLRQIYTIIKRHLDKKGRH